MELSLVHEVGLVAAPCEPWGSRLGSCPLPSAGAHPPTPFSTEIYPPLAAHKPRELHAGSVWYAPYICMELSLVHEVGLVAAPCEPWGSRLGSCPLPSAGAHPPTPFSTEIYPP